VAALLTIDAVVLLRIESWWNQHLPERDSLGFNAGNVIVGWTG
jgi:hypothetical protein